MNAELTLLVCVCGSQPESAAAYAHAARWAEATGGRWGALRIVGAGWRPGGAPVSLDLAHRLGGATLSCRADGDSAAAMASAVTNFVDGRSLRLVVPGTGPVAAALYDALVHHNAPRWPSVQVEWLPVDHEAAGTPPTGWHVAWRVSAVVGACLAVTELARPWLDARDALLVYLAGVLLCATGYGPRAALAASAASVLLFDLLALPPRGSLVPVDPADAFTVGLMVFCGVLAGHLSSRVRETDRVALVQAGRMHLLNDAVAAITAATTPAAVGRLLCEAVGGRMGIPAAVLLPPARDGQAWQLAGGEAGLASPRGLEAAREEGRETGYGTVAHPDLPSRHIPLCPGGAPPVLAVLVLAPMTPAQGTVDDWRLVRALAAQAGVVLERLRLEAARAEATLSSEAERLRNTLLAGISHDLRAPLTTIIGAASTLQTQHDALDAHERRSLLGDLLDEAGRMNRTIVNLLELTRLESGAPKLAAQWCAALALAAAAVDARSARLQAHAVELVVPPTLDVWCDPDLMGQLIGNLLDNVAVHTPPGTRARLVMQRLPDQLRVVLHDDGPGLPPGREASLFGKFVRGAGGHGGGPGLGLGLAICAAVARLHGGRLSAASDGGARFELVIPQPAEAPAPTRAARGDTGAPQ